MIVFASFLIAGSITLVSSVTCPTSADGCITAAGFSSLDKNNLKDYCTNGPIRTQQAKDCISQCNFQEPSSLNAIIASINNACRASSDCSDVINNYLNYIQCYTTNDPRQRSVTTIANSIINMFNKKENPAVTDSCFTIRFGRTCQRNFVGNCGYLQTLDGIYLLANPQIAIALSICGSEDAPSRTLTSDCSVSMVNNVLSNCGAACSIANAKSVDSLCSTLQSQVTCILSNTASCTNFLAAYLLPRLDSYAAVNEFLGCNISMNGVIIQPAGFSTQCSYKTILSDCFNIELIDQVPLGTVKQLLNFDFSIFDSGFCGKNFNPTIQASQCKAELLQCSLPVAQVLPQPSSYDRNYGQALGTFPLNLFGLNTIFTTCSAMSPFRSTLICQPSAKTNPKPTPTLAAYPTPRILRTTPKSRLSANAP